MTQPETDDERRGRGLRELEGKNIAYYSVVLQTIIESELEAAKQIAGFASAGIGLIFTVDAIRTNSTGSAVTATLCVLSVVGFAVAVITSVLYLRQASKRYEHEARGSDTQDGYVALLDARKKFHGLWRACVASFVIAIVCLAVSACLELLG